MLWPTTWLPSACQKRNAPRCDVTHTLPYIADRSDMSKITLSFCTAKLQMGGVDVQFHLFLNSAACGGQLSAQSSGRFTTRKITVGTWRCELLAAARNQGQFFGCPACSLVRIPPERSQDKYRGADKSLARPTSRCILFDGENISFDVSLVIYINSTNIPPIMTYGH